MQQPHTSSNAIEIKGAFSPEDDECESPPPDTLLSSTPEWAGGASTIPAPSSTATEAVTQRPLHQVPAGVVPSIQNQATQIAVAADADNDYLLTEDHLFRQVLQANPTSRKAGIDNVIQTLLRYATENRSYIARHVHVILRFAYDSPFDDVRAAFHSLLKELVDMDQDFAALPTHGYVVSPSAFVSPMHIVPINTSDPLVSRLFKEFFLEMGRVSHIKRVIAWHPAFCEIFFETNDKIMKSDDSPLPLCWRNYIGIMAAARHKCQYLIHVLEADFLYSGGDPDWLKGVEYIPRKLYNLLQFNALLAHQPWLLTKQHVAALVRDEDAWSMAELVHAIVLMSSFHALSGFIYGMGILPEKENIRANPASFPLLEQLEEEDSVSVKDETLKMVQRLKLVEEDDPEDDLEDESDTVQERTKAFEKIDNDIDSSTTTTPTNQSPRTSTPQANSPYLQSPSGRSVSGVSTTTALTASDDATVSPVPLSGAERYMGSFVHMKYTDFNVRSKDFKILRSCDYCWQDHAYETLTSFYEGVPQMLDREFNLIYTMTDNRVNDVAGVDTTRLRMAVWYYVHRLFGILHDDYDYQDINVFLNIPLKKYIKLVACMPENVTIEDYRNMGVKLRHEEKCHICLLVIEAKKQAQLLYGLRVINFYLNNTS